MTDAQLACALFAAPALLLATAFAAAKLAPHLVRAVAQLTTIVRAEPACAVLTAVLVIDGALFVGVTL